MGIIGGLIAYSILRCFSPRECIPGPQDTPCLGTALANLFGYDFFTTIRGKVIIDFGCGNGNEVVEMAMKAAGRVIGIDIREGLLTRGRDLAIQKAVIDRCTFTTNTDELADIIISKDSFEHFLDPAEILCKMRKLLKPDGFVLATFGPTWLHPYGGHLFSVFPWAHLVFTESSLIRWRSDFKSDGAERFSEVEGGLNRMTIDKFVRIVKDSPFMFEWFATVPIRGIRLLKHKWFREIGSSLVCCKLVPSVETTKS